MLMLVSMVGTEALEDIMGTEHMVVTMEATMARDLLMLMLVSMVGTEDTEAIEGTEELDLAVVFMEKEMLMQLPKLMQRLRLEFCMEDVDLEWICHSICILWSRSCLLWIDNRRIAKNM